VLGLVLLAAAAGLARGAGAPSLVKNAGAEAGQGVLDASGVAATIPRWTRTGNFTVVQYGAGGGFPDAAVSETINGGKNFFAGGPTNPNSGATQTVRVGSQSRAIDLGKMTATLAGYLGGYASQRDSLRVAGSFLSASGAPLGTLTIGPVTPAQRKNLTTLIAKSATRKVPPKTRSIRIALTAVRTDGSYNDGYADNIQLTLTRKKGT
jgi:hypothetical protein